jgi:OOP family OmpA-OmpF porin
VRDENDTGYKLFGGYQINRNFALEAGYFDLGKFGFNTTVPGGTLTGQIKVRGLNFDLVGTLPLTERLSVLGRVGAQAAQVRDTFVGTGAAVVSNPDPSRRAVNYDLGAGLQYAFSPSFWVRGEAERFRLDDAVGHHGNVNLYSVSLVFPFGRAPAPAPKVAYAPVYVAPAPEPVAPPPPVVAVAPPVVVPVERRRVSFSTESLFSFDKSELRAEGKAGLDTFATELAGTQFDTITVEGHTDRIGSTAYNQTLSQERADAVKAYLVSTNKVDASRINAVGKSESMPVTKAQDCKGNKASASLIACLQPDRRVEIEVVGTR